MGTDGATGQARVISGAGAAPVRVADHSNTQARPGDIKRGFAGGFDRGNVRKPKNPVIPQKKGDVKVVAYRFNGATYEIWLGGDRAEPLLVKTDITTRPGVWLDLTGSGENDWIIGATWGASNNRTIAVYHGADRSLDWELQTSITLLEYGGYGFWAQQAPRGYQPNSSNFASQQTINLPTQVFGQVIGSNCHDGIQGQNSTVTVQYCENVDIVGNADVTNGQDVNWTGFQSLSYPLPFTGSNVFTQNFRTRDYWEGAVQGPGYLGPGGDGCAIGGAEITGTELRPRHRRDATFVQNRNFSAQWYQPFAYQGAINNNAGTQIIQRQYETVTYGGFSGNVKRRDYFGKCTAFTSPLADRWSIGITNFELWDLSGIPSNTASGNGITVADSVQSWLSPTISKTSFVNAFTNTINAGASGTAARELYYPVLTVQQGCIFEKRSYSGEVFIDVIQGITNFSAQEQVSRWLNWNGQPEIEITSIPGSENNIQAGEQVYPNYWRVDLQALNTGIFEGDVETPVSKFVPTIAANKLTWDDPDDPEPKLALSMGSIGDNPRLVVAKYWDG
ncbi:MAG: hypothetical protein ACRC62_20455 [Microcoleus sp.]